MPAGIPAAADEAATRQRNAYNRRTARWRAIVDWAKQRPWVLRAIQPMSRGTGRLRFVDGLVDHPRHVHKPDLHDWTNHQLAACWIGHATTLLRVGGATVLTDPVFSTRVGLGWGFGTLGPPRFVAPACRIADLPPIDLILLSHAHFDHLDRPTLARLPKRPTVICARNLASFATDLGFARVIELDVGEQATVDRGRGLSLTVTAVPVRHWGARTILDHHLGYCAFLLESDKDARRVRVLYGADSAYTDAWRPIGTSGGVDLAVVGIGAYDPWIDGHANPEQAWTMAMHAAARKVLPMHHSTFKLSQEPMEEPLERFLRAAGERRADVVCRHIGDVWKESPDEA